MFFDTALEYENQFGKSLQSEIDAGTIKEIQNERAFYLLQKLKDGCYKGVSFTWDPTLPTSGISLLENYQGLWKVLANMSAQIYKNLGRGEGNFLTIGSEFKAIIDTLPADVFKPTGGVIGRGPIKLGVLLGRYKVFYNPAYDADEFYMGFKGTDWWEAPMYVGSYLPLMASQFMMFPDMHGEQGFISMEATKYLFPQHVIKGTITA